MTDLNQTPVSDEVFAAYVKTALWSTTDDSDDGLQLEDNYDIGDLSPETETKLRETLNDFFLLAAAEIAQCEQSHTTIAHDFWLTQNDHGAGFWDGDYDYETKLGGEGDKLGQALTEHAKSMGSIFLYIGDDGLIYA
jgi:hypothetical protein